MLRSPLGVEHWTVTARFSDAAGLAERSPVTYRGILVGSVRSIEVTPQAVVAELDINNGGLSCRCPLSQLWVLVRHLAVAQRSPC